MGKWIIDSFGIRRWLNYLILLVLNWGGILVKEEFINWFSVEKYEGNSNVKGNWIVCYS